jgi:hypothetical protein
MSVILVGNDPASMGKLIFRVRWAKDDPESSTPSVEAKEAFEAFTTNLGPEGDSKRRELLEAAGVTQKMTGEKCEPLPIQGDECAIVFEDEDAPQQIPAGKTILVVPSVVDLGCVWGVGGNLYQSFDNDEITADLLAGLGMRILQRCYPPP